MKRLSICAYLVTISIFIMLLFTPVMAFAECSCFFTVWNVKINGKYASYWNPPRVCPFRDVKVEFDYAIANREGCPGCLRQVVVGIENKPKECVFDGTPTVCTKGSDVKHAEFSIKPADFFPWYNVKTYTLYAVDYAQYSCPDAKSLFPDNPYCGKFILGRIYVDWLSCFF